MIRRALPHIVGLFLSACSSSPPQPEAGALEAGAVEARPDQERGDSRLSFDATHGGGRFEHQVPGRTLQLTILPGGRVARVHYLPADSASATPDRGWTFAPGASWPTNALPRELAEDKGDHFLLRPGELEIVVRKADATVVFRDSTGRVLSEDVAETPGKYHRVVRKLLPADEHIYGLGEKTGPLDRRGRRYEMWNSDPIAAASTYTTTSDPLYQSIPFLLGLRGEVAYGLYLASTWRSTFDVGQSAAAELRLEVEGGDLDYVFFSGPRVVDVLERYTALVGRLPLPPLWALGYHQSRWSYVPEAEVRTVAGEFRSRQIPCDSIWLDIDYMDGFRSFTWDKTRFPDPPQLLADLAQSGFKVVAILDPGIKREPGGAYAVYNDGAAQGHFVKLPDGSTYVGAAWPGAVVFPDFTRPATRAWWASLVHGLADVGVRGLWIDMNEPTTWAPGGFPLEARFDGEQLATDLREAHNVYALLMARATADGLAAAAPGRRPFVLTRAGFAGVQRHAAVWTGDVQSSWEHLAQATPMLLGLGLSGVALAGTDVGGYSGGPSPELYARWMQLGSVSPFFRSHVQSGSARQEPWSFGPEVEKISRAQIELRYRLLPYLYSAAREASERGIPLWRPLFLEYPADAKARGVEDAFLLGPYLLAAPVVHAGERARALYLPQGTWFDLAGDGVFGGGQATSVAAPLERLPLLARGGAIVPSSPLQQHIGQQAADVLPLELYPVLDPATPAATSLLLYQDEGDGLAYLSGAHQQTLLSLSVAAKGATLIVGQSAGSYASPEQSLALRVHGVAVEPQGVTRDSVALPERASPAEVELAGGWCYEAPRRLVHARLPWPRAGTTVVISYDATVPLAKKVKVQLEATLPASTPMSETVYLSSNLHGWSASGAALTRSSVTQATVDLLLDEGAALEYKYTRGSWATVEKAADCGERPNRTLSAVDGGGGKLLVSDTVARWADTCP